MEHRRARGSPRPAAHRHARRRKTRCSTTAAFRNSNTGSHPRLLLFQQRGKVRIKAIDMSRNSLRFHRDKGSKESAPEKPGRLKLQQNISTTRHQCSKRSPHSRTRSLRRQTKLSVKSLPSDLTGQHYNRPPSLSPQDSGAHSSQMLTAFGTRRQPCRCLISQLPTDFGRIVLSVKPYSPSLPLSTSSAPVPPVDVCGETPHLDCSYYEIQRHCLSKVTSLSAFLRFPQLDVP